MSERSSESPTHPDAPRAGGETPALLPCPFCGHPPYVSRSANGTEMLFVGCAVCGIEFKSAWYRDAGNPTRDIVAAWNRRASLLERHRDGERAETAASPEPTADRCQHGSLVWLGECAECQFSSRPEDLAAFTPLANLIRRRAIGVLRYRGITADVESIAGHIAVSVCMDHSLPDAARETLDVGAASVPPAESTPASPDPERASK